MIIKINYSLRSRTLLSMLTFALVLTSSPLPLKAKPGDSDGEEEKPPYSIASPPSSGRDPDPEDRIVATPIEAIPPEIWSCELLRYFEGEDLLMTSRVCRGLHSCVYNFVRVRFRQQRYHKFSSALQDHPVPFVNNCLEDLSTHVSAGGGEETAHRLALQSAHIYNSFMFESVFEAWKNGIPLKILGNTYSGLCHVIDSQFSSPAEAKASGAKTKSYILFEHSGFLFPGNFADEYSMATLSAALGINLGGVSRRILTIRDCMAHLFPDGTRNINYSKFITLLFEGEPLQICAFKKSLEPLFRLQEYSLNQYTFAEVEKIVRSVFMLNESEIAPRAQAIAPHANNLPGSTCRQEWASTLPVALAMDEPVRVIAQLPIYIFTDYEYQESSGVQSTVKALLGFAENSIDPKLKAVYLRMVRHLNETVSEGEKIWTAEDYKKAGNGCYILGLSFPLEIPELILKFASRCDFIPQLEGYTHAAQECTVAINENYNLDFLKRGKVFDESIEHYKSLFSLNDYTPTVEDLLNLGNAYFNFGLSFPYDSPKRKGGFAEAKNLYHQVICPYSKMIFQQRITLTSQECTMLGNVFYNLGLLSPYEATERNTCFKRALEFYESDDRTTAQSHIDLGNVCYKLGISSSIADKASKECFSPGYLNRALNEYSALFQLEGYIPTVMDKANIIKTRCLLSLYHEDRAWTQYKDRGEFPEDFARVSWQKRTEELYEALLESEGYTPTMMGYNPAPWFRGRGEHEGYQSQYPPRKPGYTAIESARQYINFTRFDNTAAARCSIM